MEMLIDNYINKIKTLLSSVLLFVFCSCTTNNTPLNYALTVAGDNRVELEKSS